MDNTLYTIKPLGFQHLPGSENLGQYAITDYGVYFAQAGYWLLGSMDKSVIAQTSQSIEANIEAAQAHHVGRVEGYLLKAPVSPVAPVGLPEAADKTQTTDVYMENIDLCVHDLVWVKLREREISSIELPFGITLPDPDPDGYTMFSFKNLMQIFGEYIARTGYLPFELYFRMQKRSLIKTDTVPQELHVFDIKRFEDKFKQECDAAITACEYNYNKYPHKNWRLMRPISNHIVDRLDINGCWRHFWKGMMWLPFWNTERLGSDGYRYDTSITPIVLEDWGAGKS